MQIFNVYGEDEQVLLQNMQLDLKHREDQMKHMALDLDKLSYLKGLHEEDSLRLRAIITDMQYSFESVVAQKNIEISRLSGRVKFLEEELWHLNKLPQNKYSIADKNEFDPSRMKELERQIKLKDTQIDDITQQLQEIKQQMATRAEEAANQERKKVQNEEQFKNLPFLVENDNLKKENSELKRQLNLMNNKINELNTTVNETNAELDSKTRKLREYQLIEKMRGEEDDKYKRDLQPVYVKVSEDKNLLDGVLAILHYVRESVTDLIFEIFVRSANQAYQRKTSSQILFTINVKELKDRNVRGLIIVLYLYKKMRQFIKIYFPYYGKLILHDNLARIALGETNLSEKRDGTNIWLEQCMAEINVSKQKAGKLEDNKEFNYLFKLLSLRYRTKYPMKGQSLRIDMDIRIRLESKICNSLLKLFID